MSKTCTCIIVDALQNIRSNSGQKWLEFWPINAESTDIQAMGGPASTTWL